MFVASLWPNAVGGRDAIPPEDLDARPRRRNRGNIVDDDDSDDEGPEDGGVDGQDRVNVNLVLQ